MSWLIFWIVSAAMTMKQMIQSRMTKRKAKVPRPALLWRLQRFRGISAAKLVRVLAAAPLQRARGREKLPHGWGTERSLKMNCASLAKVCNYKQRYAVSQTPSVAI
ncbi:hypothetical protein D3C87_1608990 [compost metagenome]